MDRARPKLIVMANQWGIEGWFSQIAKRRDIPVLHVMHGVLGGYLYTQTPIISDTLIVPGDFWRSLWPSHEQDKITVFNPNGYIVKARKSRTSDKRRITFFSWPLALAPYYNFTELIDGFIHLFSRLLSEGGFEITVRVHPLENPSDFVNRWKYLHGRLPQGISVDKRKPLAQILAETDVALMFRSTVMLDCLANDIPIIMPGWIDFGWNQVLMNVPSVYLAHDFTDLEQRLVEWLKDPPKVSKDVAENFVQSSGIGEASFSSSVEKLIGMSQ